jgi:hypothetical protein
MTKSKIVAVNLKNRTFSCATMLLGGFLAGSIVVSGARAQTAPASGSSTPAPAASAKPHKRVSPYSSATGISGHAKDFYLVNWGVDSFSAKLLESGQLVRFSYRVVDAKKAKVLSDKKANPVLLDQKAHAQLVIPQLEKVGQLRQSSTPEAGRVYWMAFSNRGRVVKPGDRISVVIGRFRVDELAVQ